MRGGQPSHAWIGTSRRAATAARGVPEVPLLEVRVAHRHDPHLLAEVFQREGAETRLVACRLTDRRPRRLLRWLDVEVSPERAEHLLHALRRRLRPRNLAIARLGPGRLLLRVSEPAPSLCIAAHRAGGICVACPLSYRKERDGWRVVLPRLGPTQDYLRRLARGSAAAFSIARPRPHRSDSTLTLRQDRALRLAFEMGYFDYPRRGSLGDVARALGIGRSAALEILRRASGKLAGGRYGDELRARAVP